MSSSSYHQMHIRMFELLNTLRNMRVWNPTFMMYLGPVTGDAYNNTGGMVNIVVGHEA